MTERGPVIETRDLSVGYRSRRRSTVVLRNLNLSVQPGEFVCLLGPNGIGKSTLLRTFSTIQRPLAGCVLLDNEEVHRLRQAELARRLSVVLTERVEVGALTAYNVVELGRYPYTGWNGRLSTYDHEVVRWAITSVGAAHLAPRDIGELSDGERQRVMIARALAQQPKVMLLDEPTAFLDVPSRVEMTGLLRRLAREHKVAVILSTHDLELALRAADTVWLLAPGGVLHVGGPEDLVLNGALEDTFRGRDLRFDPVERSFRSQHSGAGCATVRGDGLVAALARATLEREGYELANGQDSQLDLAVIVSGRWKAKWQAHSPFRDGSGENLAELATFARSVAIGHMKQAM
jgi:iron complex transport system ATP-binding protein